MYEFTYMWNLKEKNDNNKKRDQICGNQRWRVREGKIRERQSKDADFQL